MNEHQKLARSCWARLEILHAVVYFAPEPAQEYERLGVTDRRQQYVGSRSAALGAVSAQLAEATFYSFSPKLIAHGVPAVWDIVTPEQLIAARLRGVSRVLGGALTADDGVAEAVELVRGVTEGFSVRGRPLYAGHAALDWPEDPLLALWHGATLVREHRGDGHIAALLNNGVGGIEAAVINGIAEKSTRFNQKTKGWSDEQWGQANDRLIEQGLLTSPTELSADGAALRARIDEQTEEAGFEGWAEVDTDRLNRLKELLVPLAKTLRESGALPETIFAKFS